MAEPPPPPVVTITNPSAPGPLSDVIGGVIGKEPVRAPRRLTRAQRAVALLTAAVVGTAAAGVWAIGRIREDERLDRAAVREVAVVSAAADEEGADQEHVDLALLNEGPHPVTVLSARLDVPGFPALAADTNRLLPHNPQVVTFPLPRRCPKTLQASFTGPVLLRLRTYRGTETTVRFDGGGSTGAFAAGFVFTMMGRCGVYPPDFSLETTGVQARQAGPDLVVRLQLRNRSGSPRSLDHVAVNGGLTVRGVVQPVRLPGHGVVEVEVRLGLVECAAALGSWGVTPQQQGFTPTFRGLPSDGAVTGDVSGDGNVAADVSLLVVAQDAWVGRWVASRCPATGPATPP